MKKRIMRVSTVVLLVVLCLMQTSIAVEASAEYPTSENNETVTIDGETYTITESHSVYAVTACSHKENGVVMATTTITGYSGETCYYDQYNYEKVCMLCDKVIEIGILELPKDTPSHTYAIYRLSATNTYHTLERRCTECGFILESWTEEHNFREVTRSTTSTHHTLELRCTDCGFVFDWRTEEHDFYDVMIGCDKTFHTYKKYCRICDFIAETWKTPCRPPCDFALTGIGAAAFE